MTQPLSHRETAALAFIGERLTASSVAPTIHELREHFGFASPTAAAKLLDRLEEKGYIERRPGAHRSIRLTGASDAFSTRGLPLMGRIAAGAPLTAGEHVAEMIPVDPGIFTPKADLLFRVAGLSMINLGILDGDLAGVSLTSEARNGQVVAALITHPVTDDLELTLKTLYRKGNVITLRSENDDQATYAPMVFDTRRDAIQIIGLYAGLLRTRP